MKPMASSVLASKRLTASTRNNRLGSPPPYMTVTSTSAVRRAAPCRMAACAPKRYQREETCSKATLRSLNRSASGERIGDPVQKLFKRQMVIQIQAPLRGIRPVFPNTLHVLPQSHGSIRGGRKTGVARSEEHTSELQSRLHLVCRLLLEKR